ncbi:hypothetical protein F5141DRAFT_1067762 [Pisolithus sp. B1]|nr:hypothetical protein F5141DRAFT_1067762 [Pisolithus sp. B1]
MPEDFTHALHGIGSDSSDSSQYSDHSDSDDTVTAYWILRSSKSGIESCALGAAQIVLLSSIPQNHKRTVENNLNVILDNNISALEKKYCFCYHFWIPKDLFPLMTPPPGYDLNDPAHWSMPKSKLSGLKAELYFMVPDNLRVHVTSYSNFSCVFSNAVRAERPNILKPVKENAPKLFTYLGLNTDLFANENSKALQGSNEVVKALLKMHTGNASTHYTPLSPLLFPKPDAPVAWDLFKTRLLVDAMVFGKGILAGNASAGLIAVTATFVWYLLLSDHELTTIGEESGFKYQDDFDSSAASVAPTWESNILAQLNGPQQPTPPPHTPSPDLCFNSDSASTIIIPSYMPEATSGHTANPVIISQSTNSVTSMISVNVANLSLRTMHTTALPSLSTHGRELSSGGRCSSSRMADVPAVPPLATSVCTQEPPAKEHHTMCPHKGKALTAQCSLCMECQLGQIPIVSALNQYEYFTATLVVELGFGHCEDWVYGQGPDKQTPAQVSHVLGFMLASHSSGMPATGASNRQYDSGVTHMGCGGSELAYPICDSGYSVTQQHRANLQTTQHFN